MPSKSLPSSPSRHALKQQRSLSSLLSKESEHGTHNSQDELSWTSYQTIQDGEHNDGTGKTLEDEKISETASSKVLHNGKAPLEPETPQAENSSPQEHVNWECWQLPKEPFNWDIPGFNFSTPSPGLEDIRAYMDWHSAYEKAYDEAIQNLSPEDAAARERAYNLHVYGTETAPPIPKGTFWLNTINAEDDDEVEEAWSKLIVWSKDNPDPKWIKAYNESKVHTEPEAPQVESSTLRPKAHTEPEAPQRLDPVEDFNAYLDWVVERNDAIANLQSEISAAR